MTVEVKRQKWTNVNCHDYLSFAYFCDQLGN